MSKKWQHNKAWEDEHLRGMLTPIRILLRVFSVIPTAVILLIIISIFATLASVPIGLLAMIPTILLHVASFILTMLISMIPLWILVRRTIKNQSKAIRFAALVCVALLSLLTMSFIWKDYVWPRLKYDPITGDGVLFFASFIEQYKATTIRRLPAFEMSELEFYAWWPFRWALILFVINMIVATIRRIELSFKNLGVIMVHTGIVIIAIGSIFYQRFKVEGDMILLAGPDHFPGPAQHVFYDRKDVALYVAQPKTPDEQPQFELRPIKNLPRYNAYSLNAGIPESAHLYSEIINRSVQLDDQERTINLTVPDGTSSRIDDDIQFRVVGFAPYATLMSEWYESDQTDVGLTSNPFRMVDMYYKATDAHNQNPTQDPILRFPLFLNQPTRRVQHNNLIAIEYTSGMSDQRWHDLSSDIPIDSNHALVIEIPNLNYSKVIPIQRGDQIVLDDTGWTISIDAIESEPPFPIITPGYENASSSLAFVNIKPPPSLNGEAVSDFDRWVYHRYPELNQDLNQSLSGQTIRSDPDPEIRISYIDATKVQIYLDEQTNFQGIDNTRAIIRQPSGDVRVIDSITDDWIRDVIPDEQQDQVDLHVSHRWTHAEHFQRPVPTPRVDQDPSRIGSYANSCIAVEVSVINQQTNTTWPHTTWSQVIWIPFVEFVSLQADQHVHIVLPNERTLQLAFGRHQHLLPGFDVSLVDFKMMSYDHRGAPRDYQSIVRVSPNTRTQGYTPDFQSYQHVVKLNSPLRAPYHWDEEASWLTNAVRRLSAGVNPRQLKLSQAGWDRTGWEHSQTLTDQGVLDQPRVSWTILGVGNNPGIHIIALGSILMAIGIPWAFYLKPYLIRRENQRLAPEL